MKYNHKLYVITAQPEVGNLDKLADSIIQHFLDPNAEYSRPETDFRLHQYNSELVPLFNGEGGEKVVWVIKNSLDNGEGSVLYVAKSVDQYKKLVEVFGEDRVVNIVVEASLVDRFKSYVDTIDYSNDETCLKCLKHFINSNSKYAKHQASRGYKNDLEEGRVFKYRTDEKGNSSMVDEVSNFILKKGGFYEAK